jgi:ABC-type branched-subunit amino acid transport system permease subunit
MHSVAALAGHLLGDREMRAATLVFCVLVCLPLLLPGWILGELSRYFSYMLLAASLAFVWGHCGMLCLGQAVFFGVGAYTMSVVTLGKLGFAPWLVSSWLGIALGVGFAAMLAFVLGVFFFYARGLGGAFFGIVTLAMAVIAERLAIGSRWLGGQNGLLGVPALRAGLNTGPEILDEAVAYYVALGVLGIGVGLALLLVRSGWGLSLLAVREHEQRAEALGVDIGRRKTEAFVFGAALAALAGALFASQFNFTSPPLIGFVMSAEVLIWVALGGRGSVVGACLGALTVRLAEAWLSELLGPFWLLALGTAFLLSVLMAPRGLFGFLAPRRT